MAHAPTDPRSSPNDSTSDGDGPVAPGTPAILDRRCNQTLITRASSRSITFAGPHGEDKIEATDERARRWYHLRPEPRGRADLIGFNYTWWLIWILFIFIIFSGGDAAGATEPHERIVH
jgi:hypothetical protein